jgi:hypothetical protein
VLIEPSKGDEAGDRPKHCRPRWVISTEEAKQAAQHTCPQFAAMIRLHVLCSMRRADIENTPLPDDATRS